MEPKMLPPSMRPHNRYIVFEVISEKTVVYADLASAVWNSALAFLGDLTAAEAKMRIIPNLYDEKGQKGVIKCSHLYVEHIRVALALINIVGESRCVIRIIGVTGTIKSAEEKYLK